VLLDAIDPASAGYVPGSCPAAELLTQRLVNLPTHRRVSLRDVDAIVAALAAGKQAGDGISGRLPRKSRTRPFPQRHPA
jgi:hypothetical protein